MPGAAMASGGGRGRGMVVRRLLRLDPLDTLFFRDARPFGPRTRAESGLPKPQTIAGALRTAFLRLADIPPERVGREVAAGNSFATAVHAVAGSSPEAAAIGGLRFRGPWFWRDGDILFPVPATLRQPKGSPLGPFGRLDPLPAERALPGWKAPAPRMRPLWIHGRQRLEPVRGYVTHRGMHRFLCGGVPEPDDIVRARDLYGFQSRTGIAVDPKTSTAAEGQIYGARMLMLREGVSLSVEISAPRHLEAVRRLMPESGASVPLGGESRRVLASMETSAAPPGEPVSEGRAALAVLTTPGLFDGWRPPDVELVAASVPGHEPVSGWSLARGGPKPNRFAVAAGSVFFFPAGFRPPVTGALGDARDTALGWGAFLQGVWNDA